MCIRDSSEMCIRDSTYRDAQRDGHEHTYSHQHPRAYPDGVQRDVCGRIP